MSQPQKTMSKLEMENLGVLQKMVNTIDPELRTVCDPKIHTNLRAEIMWIRDELKDGRDELIKVRRKRLKDIFLREVTAEEIAMRRLGYAYIPTQP